VPVPCAAIGAPGDLVTEIDPICALQAAMEGFEVKTMADAAGEGISSLPPPAELPRDHRVHMEQMKNEAIICNIGHFDNEIDMAYLETSPGVHQGTIKPQVDKWT
jgi:adenosylhomocysteinase